MTSEESAKSDESSARPLDSFPVVGIGASAGGLSATTELLRHLGAAPGLGIVIVHHLDPSHESSLVEIFARATPMPVDMAKDGERVEPNRVYVLPPNAGILLVEGVMKVTPRVETGGRHLPIDRFFESLATDRGAGAIGVVLTGTGSDGSQGVKSIKEEGGFTFAQDASAEYRSMPDNAIATGCIDFILAPDAIARELVRIAAMPLSVAADDARDESDNRRILIALRKATGVDFASYKQTTVRRRVQRRLLVHGLSSLRDYASLVEQSPTEAAALCEEILIHVTSFFRDPEAFEILRESVFPKLLLNRPRDAPIRVWIPGCSTGEEVYSLAMCLLEFLADANATDIPLKLFGTDISFSAIEKARTGRYPSSIERDVSSGRLQRFFTQTDATYQIRKDVRDLCIFAKHDATRDPPFSAMDLVSCRNLMIYLGPGLQDRILPMFHYALKEPGFLLLGTSETVRAFPGFATLDAKNKIYTRTSAAPRTLPIFSDTRYADVPAPSAVTAKSSGPLDVHREADRIVLAEFAPPGVVVTDDLAIVQFRGRTGPYLEPVPGTASFDLLRMVKEELRLPLRQAIEGARSSGLLVRKSARVGLGSTARTVDLEIIPFGVASTAQRFFVVLFQEGQDAAAAALADVALPPSADSSAEVQLRQELTSTRNYLQSVIEQLEATNEELRAANEEIVSSNEELRSTNEELQMAKEELEATNEELRTVNEEMTVRNVEGMRLNDDLTNVLSSVEIPIVIVGRDSRIRRFTPAAGKVLRFVPGDVGRPIGDVNTSLQAPRLGAMIANVLAKLTVEEEIVPDAAGRFYQLTVRPYLTLDNRIDGAVVAVFDIDQIKKGELLLAEARKYAESIVDTIRESLIVLDHDLRLRSANRAFETLFGITRHDVTGRRFEELGRGEWNIAALTKSLREMREDETTENFRVEADFSHAGQRTFILNARCIPHTQSLLVALEDVTEKERAEKALLETELSFREMLATAAEAILMVDSGGKVVFANHAVAKVFGFTDREILGTPVDVLVPERLRSVHEKHRQSYLASPSQRAMGRDRSLVGRRKDGTDVPIEVVLSTMKRGTEVVTVCFIADITERRATEKQIADYQDKLQHMAFDAAVAEERERRRIAVDLHDRIGQSLALAQIKLTSTRPALTGAPLAAIDDAVALVAQSVNDTRTLTFELSPPVLYDLGLKAALSWLVEDVEKRHGIHIELSDDDQAKPMDDMSAALVFRAVRELLMNVFKHAKSPTAKLSIRRADDHVEVDVEDQGVGFDPSDAAARADGGFGLFSVQEQIGRLGGTVVVASAPQNGTKISLRVPMTSAPSDETDKAAATRDGGTDGAR